MWADLSDSEVVRRLVQRGWDLAVARAVVARRDRRSEAETITLWLDRAPGHRP